MMRLYGRSLSRVKQPNFNDSTFARGEVSVGTTADTAEDCRFEFLSRLLLRTTEYFQIFIQKFQHFCGSSKVDLVVRDDIFYEH